MRMVRPQYLHCPQGRGLVQGELLEANHNPGSLCPSMIASDSTCHSPAVRTAVHVLRSSKTPSVALYPVECTFLRGFVTFRRYSARRRLRV